MVPIRSTRVAQSLFAHLADQPREMTAFAYLDPEWRLLGMRHGPAGDVSAAEVPIRAIARDAVAFGAARVVMAHNHPMGDATPSKADLAITRRIAAVLDAVGVTLVDHLVLSRTGVTSLGAAGIV